VQAGDGGLSWSQPKRAPEAEVILDLGKQLGRCDGSHNSCWSRDTDCCARDVNCIIALPPRPRAIARSFTGTAFTATRYHPAAALTHLPRATFMRPRVFLIHTTYVALHLRHAPFLPPPIAPITRGNPR
jgi:hypothetical protein